jgi:putative acetyltransferase
METAVNIRPIRPADDPVVAAIITDVLREFGCIGQGFAIHDPEVRAMSAAYPGGRARFYVVEHDGIVAGCGGFAPLAGLPDSAATCELRKMYFRPALRGRGAGARLLEQLLAEMVEVGYRRCYLETTTQMEAARALYLRFGFAEVDAPLGATGHCGCDRYFVRDLLPQASSTPRRRSS